MIVPPPPTSYAPVAQLLGHQPTHGRYLIRTKFTARHLAKSNVEVVVEDKELEEQLVRAGSLCACERLETGQRLPVS